VPADRGRIEQWVAVVIGSVALCIGSQGAPLIVRRVGLGRKGLWAPSGLCSPAIVVTLTGPGSCV